MLPLGAAWFRGYGSAGFIDKGSACALGAGWGYVNRNFGVRVGYDDTLWAFKKGNSGYTVRSWELVISMLII